MTNEEFLKLAQECGADLVDNGKSDDLVLLFPSELLTLCREIERRTLERAAEKCDEYSEAKWQAYKLSPANHPDRANQHVEGQSDGAGDCAVAIRAMIKESE